MVLLEKFGFHFEGDQSYLAIPAMDSSLSLVAEMFEPGLADFLFLFPFIFEYLDQSDAFLFAELFLFEMIEFVAVGVPISAVNLYC